MTSNLVGFPPPNENPRLDRAFLETPGAIDFWLGLRMTATCRSCQAAVPLNGFTDALLCNRCGGRAPLELATWKRWLDADVLQGGLAREPAFGVHVERPSEFRCVLRRVPPHCVGCSQQLPEGVLALEGARREIDCPSCQRAIRHRPADASIPTIVPGARWLVGEGVMASTDGASTSKASKPVAFACMQCGGPLSVDGTSRMLNCQYCSTPNYLPDEVWFALHPAPKVEEFYIGCQLDERKRWEVLTSGFAFIDEINDMNLNLSPIAREALESAEGLF